MKFSTTITNRLGETEEHEIAIPEKMLAMLAASNIRDPRLRHNIRASWDDPASPKGMIRIDADDQCQSPGAR